MLVHHLRVDVGFIKIEKKDLHLNFYPSCPKTLRDDLANTLSKLTNEQWSVINSEEESSTSLKKQEEDLVQQIEKDIRNNPLVLEALKVFEGTEIDRIEINKKVL